MVWIFFVKFVLMLKTRFLKLFKYVCILIFVGASLQCVNNHFNYSNFKVNVLSEISFSSGITKTPLVVLNSSPSNTFFNHNDFFEIEEEFEKNKEIAKRNSLPVLTLANLFRSFYSREIRTPFALFHSSSNSLTSIPLHVRNCIFLI